MHLADTIIAVSSAAISPGGGGIRGIIRLSGPEAWRLAGAVADLPEGTGVGYHGPVTMPLLHPTVKLAAVMLFKAPRSFTGEDVAELHVPGAPALMGACIDALLRHGKGNARLATAGEFSARAFFNGKMDLTEAEGIAATINASTDVELRAAASLREGALHQEISRVTQRVAEELAAIEAGIDFSDEEDISFVSAAKLASTLDQLGSSLEYLLITSLRIDRLDVPPTVVFIGRPNVGKSSLINALAGQDRSIVSPVAGTTRDILAVTLAGPSGAIRLLDVPGEEIPWDELRDKMMEARRLALLEADLVIRVVDGDSADEWHDWDNIPGEQLTVRNKIDLLEHPPDERDCWPPRGGMRGPISARTGHNIGKLRDLIFRLTARNEALAFGSLVLNQRHRLILQEAKAAIWNASRPDFDEETLRRSAELLAADLRRALDLLGQITGAISPDEVLGRIFSRFCIGK